MEAGLFDDKNISLFNELQDHFTITVELVKDTDNYSCYSKNNTSTIYVPENQISAESFTHELLHIYLRSRGVFIGSRLTRKLSKSKDLSRIYTSQLLQHISNCLDHIKMLPLFLDLGYKRHGFISDYHKHKCHIEELCFLESAWQDSESNYYQLIEFYLEKYFAIKACPNLKFDYGQQLKILEKLDKSLFDINEQLIQKWNNMSIELGTHSEQQYIETAENYIYDMKKWVIGFRPLCSL